MKLLALLLSVYILMLSAMPCADNVECNDDKKTVTSTSIKIHGQHNHTEEHCPPLCHCSCCNIVVTVQPFVKISANGLFATVEKTFPHFTTANLTGFSGNVFQPPQLI